VDSSSLTIIIIVALFAIILVAAFLVFRQRAKARIKVPGAEFELDASDQKPPQPHAIEIEDAETTAGGILAQDETGGGVGMRKVKAQDDIIATTKKSEGADPKA